MKSYENIYFIGVGGIGMSNLARYFMAKGLNVGGYDKTATTLTEALSREGAFVHYNDSVEEIPNTFKNKETTLIVFTPAIPVQHTELNYFKSNGYVTMKRAQVLGEISANSQAICVAGTHGKTTVSSMIAHLLRQSTVDCNAFLGGILKNYDTNLLLSDKSPFTVVEADEYDRSFHRLHPWFAIITAADPDHLDIYGTAEAYRESFEHFTSLVVPDGFLLMKTGVAVTPCVDKSVTTLSYSETSGDYYAQNVRIGNGTIIFDFVSPSQVVADVELGVPVRVNVENAVAAMAVAEKCGATADELRQGMRSFGGPRRRFDFWLKTDKIVLLDDYAHHPQELEASIKSIKQLYPDRKVTGVFQPHLYTRTRDFADEFATALSLLEDVILLDIYPAREEPIAGVSSQIIFDKITSANKLMCAKENLLEVLNNHPLDVLVTLGAGDIDRQLPHIKSLLENKYL